ncbi:MAG: lipopolysaccharide heptosyltransferase II [Candidatus Omnitrophota bacterium]
MKTDIKGILIVEVNWLGDVLFSTPLIKAIRGKFKGAYIACMLDPRTREILEHNPAINEIIIYDEKGEHRSLAGKMRLVSLLRRKKFDLAVLLHRSFTKALITRLAGIGERAGYATKKRRALLLTHSLDAPEAIAHKVEYFLRIAQSLGCDTSDKSYEFFVTDKKRKYIDGELAKEGVKEKDLLVVINTGANWPPKRWSETNFARLSDVLITKYGAKVVAAGAKNDLEIAERIKEKMSQELIILAGRTNLEELGALTERADFVISGDTGPMHIAVAMKSRVIALFGPTSPALTGPYGSGNYRIIQKDVGCEVPCYDLTCDNYKCMDAITVDDVLRTFAEMYGQI